VPLAHLVAEDTKMRHFAGILTLATVLGSPLIIQADDEHHDRNHDQRYYDTDHRDYHEWNEHEEQAYRHYLEERHERYRDYQRLNRKQQREYWRWRHEHPDVEERR
jgi:hypothetical protein